MSFIDLTQKSIDDGEPYSVNVQVLSGSCDGIEILTCKFHSSWAQPFEVKEIVNVCKRFGLDLKVPYETIRGDEDFTVTQTIEDVEKRKRIVEAHEALKLLGELNLAQSRSRRAVNTSWLFGTKLI